MFEGSIPIARKPFKAKTLLCHLTGVCSHGPRRLRLGQKVAEAKAMEHGNEVRVTFVQDEVLVSKRAANGSVTMRVVPRNEWNALRHESVVVEIERLATVPTQANRASIGTRTPAPAAIQP